MRTKTPDYYSILNVERSSTIDDIKKAFRKLALRFHPDKNPGDIGNAEKFKEITRAYEVLKDPRKRSLYDISGSEHYTSTPAPGFDNRDPFGMRGMGCGMGRGRGCGRGRGFGAWNSVLRNSSIHDIAITRAEARTGTEITLKTSDGMMESVYTIKLPENIENGTILRCGNDSEMKEFYIRVSIHDR